MSHLELSIEALNYLKELLDKDKYQYAVELNYSPAYHKIPCILNTESFYRTLIMHECIRIESLTYNKMPGYNPLGYMSEIATLKITFKGLWYLYRNKFLE